MLEERVIELERKLRELIGVPSIRDALAEQKDREAAAAAAPAASATDENEDDDGETEKD